MLKFKRDIKALSPVVASIILIAVVVAVSLAATTWMGSMSFNFMKVDELSITDHSFASDVSYVDLTVKNFGTTSVTINKVGVNDVAATDVQFVSGDSTLDAGETAVIRVTQGFKASNKYEFTVVTSSSTKIVHVATASSSGVPEDWYDAGWLKRAAVTVDNSLNPDELTCYQIRLVVPYDSDMTSDFSDLRFTLNDGQSSIPYWLENYVDSVSAVVWVKVPVVPASSTETVYMYYGKPSAASAADPDGTFEVFVDFTRDGVISYGGSSQDVNSAQWEIIDDTTLRMWGNNWKATMKTLSVDGDGSQAICFDYKSAGVQAEINGVGVDTDNSISANLCYQIYGTQTWALTDH